MITIDIWFIGMIILVVFQQGVIIWLTNKLIKNEKTIDRKKII